MVTMPRTSLLACLFLFLSTFGDHGLVEAENAQVVIDAYPNTDTVEQGTTLVLMCRVVGVPSTTVLSYQWTCPGGSCDAGAVDPEWAAKVQQGNILVVNVRNGNDAGVYTCTVMDGNTPLVSGTHSITVTNGLSFLNEDGGLKVFFPRNSFVTNTTLTHTDTPRQSIHSSDIGNDHIACYGGDPQAAQVTWHNSIGGALAQCRIGTTPVLCEGCGPVCERNGAVGVNPSLNGHTSIHLFLDDDNNNYVNQDLQCRVNVSDGQSAFIGVYLSGGASTLSPPSNLMTSGTTTTTTVSVSWSPVLSATGYYVSYQRQDLRTPPVVTPQYERIVGGASTSVTLSDLEPGTTYRIRVWSTDGASVSSEAGKVDVTTVESVPSPPRMLTMIGTPTGSTVELNWLPPIRLNGAVHYEIVYEPAKTSGPPVNAGSISSLYFTLTLPSDLLSYNVRVEVVNGQGQTSSNVLVIDCTGPERGPDTPTAVSTVVTDSSTVMVSWNRSSSGMCDVLATNYNVRYRLSSSTGDHTTVNTSGTSVTLVDLVPNAEYDVEVAAIFSNGAISNFSAVAQFTVTPPEETEPTSSTGAIVAVVIVLLVLITAAVIAAVIIGIIFWRRKKKGQPYQSPAAANKPVHMSKVAAVEYDYANIADIDTRTVPDNPNAASSERDYAVVNKKSTEKIPGVGEVDGMSHTRKPPAKPSPYKGAMSNGERPLMNDAAFDGFLKQVEQMHSQGKSSFEAEFNSIEKATASSTTVAELNNVKNRYKNIFPYDSSRVVLSVPNTIGTDYINASFVDGYHNKDSFIACQAPVPGTVDDFWQMMWDQRINIVVMLTKTMEGSKRKSEDYYPVSPGDTFSSGRFQIRTISLKYHVDYEVRVLEVAQASNPSQTHTLDHYLFTGWPDYGVPKYPTSLIRMLYHVREARVSDVPIVVHCSAGVGRSGTFIALDVTLDQMNAEQTVDIKGTVKKMREKRMQMIQTPAQYIFVYDAVRELLLLGDTTIKANELRKIIAQLKSKSGGKGTGYQQQFTSLNTLTQESADDEMVEDIPHAIRYPDRAPIKGKHLYVSKPEAGGTFFINASYVDGYHAHRAFIAAQSPLQYTVTDFWTLISEKRVQTVLLLCPLVEDAQDTCHIFWPAEGGTVEFGKMKALLLHKSTSNELDTYKMTIQKPRSTQDVTLLHYKQWPEKRRPRSASFLKLFTSAQKLQQPHSDKPILVACNDGLGRTGTFIAIWSLIEQMKAEGQIDVVGTIKSIRTQRPGAVPLLDQYVYCHDILLEYVDSFEGYSNFNIQ